MILQAHDQHRSRIVTDILIPLRSEIAPDRTWNAPSVFESVDAWDAAFQDLSDGLSELAKYKGHLSGAPSTLVEAIEVIDHLQVQLGKILVYALMSHSVDTTDQAAVGRFSKAQGLASRMIAAAAFFEPEVLAIGMEALRKWMEEEPGLAVYEHYFDDLFRKQAHVRSPEIEELLGMLVDPFEGVAGTARMLTNADFNFPPATANDGAKIPLTHGTLVTILAGEDRQARRTAWENYMDLFLAHKNALAASLETSIKQNAFLMRARGHKSTLEAALFSYNIPVQVFHNLIDAFKKNLPTWHRYWAIRRKALAVDELHPYDIWAPLTQDRPRIPYEQGVEWICRGLVPLGEAYVAAVRNGCLRDRWVDVYPNKGKRAGAFSSGRPGTYPFILTSYGGTIFNLSTLAHELGHSMHSYLTWQNQPIVYSDYSLFVAEVASNFHQAMVRDHLLKENSDPSFQISVIEEAMSNFHRYFLIMPTLARFELEMHEAVERGGGLTADRMIERLAELFAEAYGDEMRIDRDRVGIQWATFPHLFVDYYVYQYATGISGANVLAKRVLSGEEGAVEDYLTFLKVGNALYPLDALKGAGVDLTKPDAVNETFAVLAGMVDRLEELVS
jgi:oligoendopeptidase F